MADESWIEWKGGGCPVAPETVVEVRVRDGSHFNSGPAGNFCWRPFWRSKYDIVAYRVVVPTLSDTDRLRARVADAVSDLEHRAQACADLVASYSETSEADRARLAGKAQAYAHAAEFVKALLEQPQ